MSFWIVAVAITAAVTAVLALPLLRSRVARSNPAAHDLEVYRDQIAELERERERGVLTQDEMEAARTEIARRMLAADARLKAQDRQSGKDGKSVVLRAVAAALVIAVPLGAVLLYLQLGDPGAGDMPLHARTDLPAPGQAAEQDQLIAGLEQATRDEPANPEHWLNLGLTYKQMRRYEEAAGALRKALGLQPPTPMLNSEYGEVLVMASGGTVTPEARAAFEAVLEAQPDDPRAMHYLALGDYQADRTQEALDRWAALIAASPADAPWLGVIREHLAQAAKDLDLDVADVMPEPLPPAAGSVPDIAAMVAQLAARLAEEPDNLEGWLMLARSYTVLGELEAAREAMASAVQLAPDDPSVVSLQATAIREANGGSHNAESIAVLRRLLVLDPRHTEALWVLGNAEAEAGNRDKAVELLERAYRMLPQDSADRDMVRQRIDQIRGG